MIVALVAFALMLLPAPGLAGLNDEIDDILYIDDDTSPDAKKFKSAGEKVLEELREQREKASTAMEKDQLKRTTKSTKKSLQKVANKMKKRPRKWKSDYSRVAEGLLRLNEKLGDLRSPDIEVRWSAICEVSALILLASPPPIGPAISSLAMIGAVIFGSMIKTDQSSTELILRKELVMQYEKELYNNLKAEATVVDHVLVQLETRYEKELEASLECQKNPPEINPDDGTVMTKEEQERYCDLTAITPENKRSMINSMNDAMRLGIQTRSTIRSHIKDELCEIKSIAQMEKIRGLLSLIAQFATLRFVMFTQMKLYVDTFIPNATHAYETEEKWRIREADILGDWIDDTLGKKTPCELGAVLALYLLRNPVKGMDVLTDKIADTMNEALEDMASKGSGDHTTWVQVDYDGAWTYLGYFQHCYDGNWVIAECLNNQKYCTGMPTFKRYASKCLSTSNDLRFERYNQTDIKQGFIISQVSNKTWIWGTGNRSEDSMTGLVSTNRNANVTAFAFHPVDKGSYKAYVFMPTIRNGKKPEVFSILRSYYSQYFFPRQLVVNDKQFSKFNDLRGTLFWFNPKI